ncbi:pyruvate ferredoxin oxidoreductase subunit gamma [Candidatus Micrarchaeota archaeon]|nr:pyruvate ferredoxin oxidoreductase subunit gamma [Candidatus Micrarchaeota archaeon]
MIEVTFWGRGGQGAVTAAELLAVAASMGGKYAQAFPYFGVERRGAPVRSFCRIDDKPIRVHQQVYNPDYVVILDASLIGRPDILEGFKKDGIVVVNTGKPKKQLKLKAKNLFTVDATEIAIKNIGRPIVNTAMLGAFIKATNLVPLDALKEAIKERFNPQLAEKNIKAIEDCHSGCV